MKKVIKLTESELTALVKRVIKEVAEEPIKTGNKIFGTFGFAEGKLKPSTFNGAPVTNTDVSRLVNDLVVYLQNSGTLYTMKEFIKNPKFPLPKFIKLNVGTSHSGGGETNAAVAQGRLNFLTGVVMKAFDSLGIDTSIAKSIVITNSDAKYQTSSLDKNFYDPKKVNPNASERYGWIEVAELNVKGLNTGGIQNVQRGLNSAKSIVNNIFVDGVDEEEIARNITKLQTFSDIEDLDAAIQAQGLDGRHYNLETFLNDQLFDDPKEMGIVFKHLQKCALSSGKQADTVRIVSGKISIGGLKFHNNYN
jgi:hypothetical protein